MYEKHLFHDLINNIFKVEIIMAVKGLAFMSSEKEGESTFTLPPPRLNSKGLNTLHIQIRLIKNKSNFIMHRLFYNDIGYRGGNLPAMFYINLQYDYTDPKGFFRLILISTKLGNFTSPAKAETGK